MSGGLPPAAAQREGVWVWVWEREGGAALLGFGERKKRGIPILM